MDNSEEIRKLPLLAYPYDRHSLLKKNSYESFLKRAFDFCLALVALPFLIPVILVLMALVGLGSSGPAIYRSERIGLGGKKFKIYKLRTMWSDASERLEALLRSDANLRAEWEKDQKLKNDPRVTPLGKILRTLSLDELPQILNILKGEMSFVGPRPIVEDEIEKYGVFFRDYKQVKPGLTGLWQISGRNDVSYATRVALDTEYSQSITWSKDFKILIKTISVAISKRGAY